MIGFKIFDAVATLLRKGDSKIPETWLSLQTPAYFDPGYSLKEI